MEWQKFLLFAHKIVYSMEWSLGAEYWSGVESDFGVAKVEWSAVVMLVYKLKRRLRGRLVQSLHVKMPHCWKPHVAAHMQWLLACLQLQRCCQYFQ